MENDRKEQMSGVDNGFLRIESDIHLMTISSCWIFSDKCDRRKLEDSLLVMIDRFPRLSMRVTKASRVTGAYKWEPYNFNIADHVVEHHLAADPQEDSTVYKPLLTAYLSERISEKLDRNQALWMCDLIYINEHKSALLFRIHHCVTDGQGAVRTLLSLTTDTTNNDLQYAQKAPKITKKTQILPIRIVLLFCQFLLLLWGFVLVNWHIVYVILFSKKRHFKGEMKKEKIVEFVEDISLHDVKTIKNQFNVTVNDVLCSALAGAFRKYMMDTNNGKLEDKELLSLIPVSMRKESDWTLGNKVSSLWVWLPLSIEDPLKRLKETNRRMKKMKSTTEPIAEYIILKTLGNTILANLPGTTSLTRYMLTKPHTVFTNVPGPRSRLQFADVQIDSYIPFLPQPGAGGLGVALLSYADSVACSIVADRHILRTDVSSITSNLKDEINLLLRECTKKTE